MGRKLVTGLAAALVVSAMANMFLLAMGTSRRHGGPDRGPMGGPPPPAARMLEAARDLPDGARASVGAIARTHEKTMETAMRAMDGYFAEMNALMTSRDFDAEKLKDLHRRMDTADAAIKKEMEETTLAIAARLSPDERIAFFKRLMPPRGGHHDDMPPPPPHSGNTPDGAPEKTDRPATE